MDKVELNYSTKNIPIHNRKEYQLSVLQKTRVFLRNLRWKAFFFLKPKSKIQNKDNYGFKSEKNAPIVPEMKKFEEDLINLVQNIKFKNPSEFSSEFQKKLSQDIKKINENPNVIVKGDKTTNHYSIGKNEYQEVLQNTITKEYKKCTAENEIQATKVDKNLASK